jgi:type IV secretion system protein VirD4
MSWPFNFRARRNAGIYLGQVWDKGQLVGEACPPTKKHLVTIGPNGTGKGTGVIVPNLQQLRRSILIIDPKGEAAAITARHRAKFGRVIVLNPFNVMADRCPWLKSHGFSSLDVLNPKSQRFPDDATGIAEALVKIDSKDPHWSSSAQELIAALVMWECIRKREKGRTPILGDVRKMLTEPYSDAAVSGLLATAVEMLATNYEPLQAKAGRFVHATRENQSVVATAITQTRFLDSPAVSADLSQGGFDFADMKREIVTVYLILPANYLETHSGWLRLMVVSALRALLQGPPSSTLPPVLFMLDEFAQLGYLPPIENAMGIARGFGVQLWPFLQDLNQLKSLYKDRWETFIGARGALTAFAPQDWFTAEYLSKLTGQATRIVESWNQSDDLQGSGRDGRNWAPQGLPLFRPEELMRLGASRMLCLAESERGELQQPFLTSAPGYWDTPYHAGLDPNPYFV